MGAYGKLTRSSVKYSNKLQDLKGMFWQKLMGAPAYGDTTGVKIYKIATDL
jgi:hypothetical protein